MMIDVLTPNKKINEEIDCFYEYLNSLHKALKNKVEIENNKLNVNGMNIL